MRDFAKQLTDKPRTEIEIIDSINVFTKHVEDTVKNSKIAFISLCGAWGSGKTSLLKTLEKHKKSMFHTYCFFHFSSWTSNDINMKRDFLLKLIETINMKQNNSMYDSWIEAVLSGKKIKKPCPCINRIGQFLAWLLLTILIFGIWISIGETVYNLINEVPWYMQWSDLWKWGIIFTLTVLSIIPLLYYTQGDATKTIPAFLPIDNSEPNTDLSDYQFQNYLLSILTYLPEGIKLFIILDDIDRIMPDQIPSSLSLLFSLKEFTDKQNTEETEENKIIIVTPYDKEQFQNILKNTIPQSQKENHTVHDPVTKDIFPKFMDKLFLLQVPIPVLSYKEMIKTFYSNLYEAGFEIIPEQPKLTDVDVVVKLSAYLSSFFLRNNHPNDIIIGNDRHSYEEVRFQLFNLWTSPDAPKEVDIDDSLCQKLVNGVSDSNNTNFIKYLNISNLTEFYNSLAHCMYKEYNELIGSPQNRSFKKMYQLYFYSFYIQSVLNKFHYMMFNLREQIVFINRMVTYRKCFEQKFEGHSILTEEKENIFDILILCAIYQDKTIRFQDKGQEQHYLAQYLSIYKDFNTNQLRIDI